MQSVITTERLTLQLITENDSKFMLELLNTKGWLQFIGDRNVRSNEDAIAYIKKIQRNPSIRYWVVSLTEDHIPIGVISFIKRTYLEHYDIGFAFLPAFGGHGYAYEAANAVLLEAAQDPLHVQIVATTVPQNTSSIRLLKKMGLEFKEAIKVDDETLHVYSVLTDKLQ